MNLLQLVGAIQSGSITLKKVCEMAGLKPKQLLTREAQGTGLMQLVDDAGKAGIEIHELTGIFEGVSLRAVLVTQGKIPSLTQP